MELFLTGITGFLGGELLMLLSGDPRIERIYCLIRAAGMDQARARLQRVFDFHGDALDPDKVVPVLGDLSDADLAERLGADPRLRNLRMVIHGAANTSFSPIQRNGIRRVNIDGAERIFRWAAGLSRLETFVYVGTAWIRGIDNPHALVTEDESPDPSYRQLVEYCRSKSIGEIMLRSLLPAEKLLVVRPSIIIGDSRPWTPRSYSILWALAGFELMRLVPMNPEARCDVIPVDFAAHAIVTLLFAERRFDTYHISAGLAASTPISRFLRALDIPGRPPFVFVNHATMMGEMKQLFRNRLPETAELLREHGAYVDYWKTELGGVEPLRVLLAGLDYYFRFVNLDLVFDNTRLLADTGLAASEPAHVYMERNRLQLRAIDIMSGATDP